MKNAPFDDEFDADGSGPSRTGRSRWLIFLPVLLLVLFLWPGWAGFYSEWLWFQELGFQRVFTRTLLTKFGLGAIVYRLAQILGEGFIGLGHGFLPFSLQAHARRSEVVG